MTTYEKDLKIYNLALATMYRVSFAIGLLPPTVFAIVALVFAGVVPVGQFIFVTVLALIAGIVYAKMNKPTPPTQPTE